MYDTEIARFEYLQLVFQTLSFQNNSEICYHKCILNTYRCVQVQTTRCNESNLFLQRALHISIPHQELKTESGTCYPNTASLNLADYELTKNKI